MNCGMCYRYRLLIQLNGHQGEQKVKRTVPPEQLATLRLSLIELRSIRFPGDIRTKCTAGRCSPSIPFTHSLLEILKTFDQDLCDRMVIKERKLVPLTSFCGLEQRYLGCREGVSDMVCEDHDLNLCMSENIDTFFFSMTGTVVSQ
jgi:hypothetical protein